jgi:drug/metabolite transporter (DMT)-like permease
LSSRGKPNPALGILLAASGAAVISFDSLLVRLQALSPAGILFWRGLFSGFAFAVLAAAFGRRANGTGFRVGAGDWWPLIVLMALMVLGTVTFVLALTHTTVAHTLVIIASSPILTAVLGRILLGEELPVRTWVAGFIVLAGVVLVFSGSLGGGHFQGDLWAVVNTGILSLILIALRKYQQVNRLLALAASGLVIAVAAGPSGIQLPDVKSMLAAALAGLILLPAGLVLITFAPRHLPAAEVGLLLLLETVLAPVWALLVVGEQLNVQVVLSGAIILGAVSSYLVLDLRSRRATGPEALMPKLP